MSLSGSANNDDEDYAGHVATRVVRDPNLDVHLSWALDNDDQQVPNPDQVGDVPATSHFRSFPEPSQKHGNIPVSSAQPTNNNVSSPPKDSSSFKSWLTSGMLGALNAAAGATLSTTGHLIGPPLHVTKTVLLPGLLALFVDTLDATAPERAKDWFRIISSSIHHLVSVIGSTKSGQKFSSNFLLVLHDILRVLSSPETRQVLVDGMAAGVKIADALNTPEMHAWVDHMVILGCRIVDAAASGSTKQLLCDSKDLALSGAEMASDPAATLAFAEVTAHLCYALEDIQHSLKPSNRSRRNKQNESTYVEPLQMPVFSSHRSTECVILSSLGLNEKGDWECRKKTNSSALLGEERAEQARSSTDRAESVDVQFLKERIDQQAQTQTCSNMQPSSVLGGATEGSANTEDVSLPSNRSDQQSADLANSGQENSDSAVRSAMDPVRRDSADKEDMEDLMCDELPVPVITSKHRNRYSDNPLQEKSKKETREGHFYRLLDNFLEENRKKRTKQDRGVWATMKDTKKSQSTNATQHSWIQLQAKAKKLKQGKLERKAEEDKEIQGTTFRQLPKIHQLLVLVAAVVVVFFLLAWSAFGFYGIYMYLFAESRARGDTAVPESSELVIRVIREIVHVQENGPATESAHVHSISNSEIDGIANCVASHYR